MHNRCPSLLLLTLVAVLSAAAGGCVRVERVQGGPDNWPSLLSKPPGKQSPVTSKPHDDNGLRVPLFSPASQPDDIQTPEEIIDELLEQYQ